MDKDNKNKDILYGHITDRVQKMTAALYRVTNLFSDKEPLKWTLRDNAVNIYTKLMSIRTNPNVLKEVMDGIRQIISALELASTGTFISSINFEILRKEYINLSDFIEGKKDIIAQEQKLLIEPIGHKPLVSNGHSNGQKQDDKKAATDIINQESSVSIDPEERKEKIKVFLGKNGKKTIREISSIFNNLLSEKSVQRDLLEMVKSGELMAKGEKRWRTYSLT